MAGWTPIDFMQAQIDSVEKELAEHIVLRTATWQAKNDASGIAERRLS